MAHLVTFIDILRAVVDTARQGTGARIGYVGQPTQKPEVPFFCWVEFIDSKSIARNHSGRDTDSGHLTRAGVEHVINATITVMVGVFSQGGSDEMLALATTAQDLMCAFEADETLMGTHSEDLVDSCTLGVVTVVRAPWDEQTVYAGVTAPVVIRKLR